MTKSKAQPIKWEIKVDRITLGRKNILANEANATFLLLSIEVAVIKSHQ